METSIRFLQTGARSAAFNMGLDEVLMGRVKPEEPILRFYSWKPAAVSIGNFQKLEDEVDLAACKKHGVDVVRRITGGGAVFHDAEITYSFITREYPAHIIDSYKWICGGVILGLANLGIEAQFVPINDIVVGQKKVSGNAQTRKKGVLLQHGTILLDVDVERMFSLLKVPNEKMRDKLVQNVKERVSGTGKGFEETALALQDGFESALKSRLSESRVSADEQYAAEKLAQEKYASRAWNYLR